jgi:hypothetical protein
MDSMHCFIADICRRRRGLAGVYILSTEIMNSYELIQYFEQAKPNEKGVELGCIYNTFYF